jgi:hypothetical protein
LLGQGASAQQQGVQAALLGQGASAQQQGVQAAITGPSASARQTSMKAILQFMLINGILPIGTIDINSQRILLMNLYLNVIFKIILSNNALKQKYDASKTRNKPPYIPLTIQETFMTPPPKIYELKVYPKTNFNDADVINKLNTILETKLENATSTSGGYSKKYKFLNEMNKNVKNTKYIKKQKTLKKKIGKIKNKYELEKRINAKIKKYIKNYIEKKEKQLEDLEMKIINAKKSFTQQHRSYSLFDKKENKNRIKSRLDSKINKKVNNFNKMNNKMNNKIKFGKHKKNNTRKNY